MRGDGTDRLDYLSITRSLLWPGGPAGPGAAMTVLPGRRRARLFTPTRPRRAAASAALRYSAQHDLRGRLAGGALAAGVELGLIGRPKPSDVASNAPGSESIDGHLAAVLGQPVLTSLALTRDRANRKPVLQVFDRSGRTLAFAKVGVSDLTRALVRAESAALRELADRELRHVTVPTVIDLGSWNGLDVLVMSALPAFSRRRTEPGLLDRAMREVALGAPDRDGVLVRGRTVGGQDAQAGGDAAADYHDRLRARRDAARATAEPGHVERWTELFEAEVTDGGHAELDFGAWHGDWARWNFVARGERLAVWDWERYDRPAPLGYDALHYFLQGQVGTRRDRFATGAPSMIEHAPDVLVGWPVSARAARTTAVLYILDIALRYLADGQRTTGGGGAVENWAFPAVAAARARP